MLLTRLKISRFCTEARVAQIETRSIRSHPRTRPGFARSRLRILLLFSFGSIESPLVESPRPFVCPTDRPFVRPTLYSLSLHPDLSPQASDGGGVIQYVCSRRVDASRDVVTDEKNQLAPHQASLMTVMTRQNQDVCPLQHPLRVVSRSLVSSHHR